MHPDYRNSSFTVNVAMERISSPE